MRGGREALTILMASATAVGVFLRLDDLTSESLWLDEILAVRKASEPTVEALMHRLGRSPFPPLYYLALWGWVRVWGLSDASIRGLPACLGILTLPLTHRVWVGLIGRRSAAWATSLLALNAFHVSYSRDAKMYAAVWLLSACSSGAFLHLTLDERRRRGWILAYVASGACLLLVSYVGIATLAVHVSYGIYLLLSRRVPRRVVLVAGGAVLLAVLACAFWIPTAASAIAGRTGPRWLPPVRIEGIPAGILELCGIFLVGYRPPDGESPGIWARCLGAAYAPCLLVTAALLASRWMERRGILQGVDRAGLEARAAVVSRCPQECRVVEFLALWLLLPVAAALAFSLAIYPVWGEPRYLIGSAPALILWVSVALGAERRSWLAWGGGLTLLGVNLAVVAFERSHHTLIPWRETARAIAHVATGVDPAGDGVGSRGWDQGKNLVTPMKIVNLTKYYQINCLDYAFHNYCADCRRIKPIYTDLATALGEGTPFVLVGGFSASDPDRARRELEERIAGQLGAAPASGRFTFSRVSSERVFNGNRVPDPSGSQMIQVWLGMPTERGRSEARPQRSSDESRPLGGG